MKLLFSRCWEYEDCHKTVCQTTDLLDKKQTITQWALLINQTSMTEISVLVRLLDHLIKYFNDFIFLDKGHNYPPVYSVDSTDVSHWTEKVHDPAVQIVQDYMNVSLYKMNADML